MAKKGVLHFERLAEGYKLARLWAVMPQEAWDELHRPVSSELWTNKITVQDYLKTTVPKVNDILKKWYAS